MMNKIPINDIFGWCKTMLEDEWGYILGTAGILWTQSRQDATENEMAKKYGSKWIGHTVADCSGVMVYIWKQYGLSIYHGSNTIARKYCGEMTKVPHKGFAAFKWRKYGGPYSDGKGDFYHIGIVDENAEYVYESRSTQAGFRHDSPVSKWDFFAPFTDFNYGEVAPLETWYRAYVNTEKGSLNLRVAPGTNSRIITTLEKGTVVDVYSVDGDWSQVSPDGGAIVGWCSSKYLTKIKTSAQYGVFIPCESEEEAIKVSQLFKIAEVREL